MFGASKSGRVVSGGGTVTDAQIKYVTTLLTGDGTNGATNGGSSATTVPSVISDASTNNFNLVIAGDVKPNRFNPNQDGYYGNYFPSVGDYVSFTDTASFGTGDFTVECFVFPTASAHNIIMSSTTAANWDLLTYGNQIYWHENGGNLGGGGYGTVPQNQWVHLAASRTGGNLNLYINGTRVYSAANTFNYSASASRLVGPNGGSAAYYASNVRLIKGTGIYSGTTITVPTAPLTPITGTSLLTCQSPRFIDNGPNSFALTAAGSPSITYQQPFAQPSAVNVPNLYSGKFDGSGNNVSVANNAALQITSGDTNTFIAEAWVYFKTVTASTVIFDKSGRNTVSFANWAVYLNGSSQFTLQWGASGSPGTSSIGNLATTIVPTVGTWYHVAFVKSSSDWALFINGTRQTNYSGLNTAADANPGPLRIGVGITSEAAGVAFNGIISNVRVYKGTAGGAPYSATSTTLTVPTAPLTAITGTSLLTLQGPMFVDNSTNALAVTGVGTAQPLAVTPFTQTYTSSASANYGSAYFDGTGDYLTAPSNSAFQLGTSSYTIEAWIYPTVAFTVNSNNIINIGTYVTGLMLRGTTSNGLEIFTNNTQRLFVSTAITTNAWQHIALVRNVSACTLYVNGVSVGTFTDSSSISPATATVSIGIAAHNSAEFFNGYISNLRIVNGTAVYTAAFTPPAAPLTAVTNTSLLTLQYNGATNDSGFIDSSPNDFTITRFGNTTQGSAAPFGPNWSNYFSGVSDSLTVTSPSIVIGTADFTVEFWFNFNNADSTRFDFTDGSLQLYRYSDNTLYYLYGGTNRTIVTSFTQATYGNKWVHLAISRNSGNIKVFINGTQVNTTYADSSSYSITSLVLAYNAGAGAGTGLNGYMSNFRIVNGTGLYPSNFTPPTAPLTAVTNTKLLTCQSPTFIDNGPNAFALTTSGTPSVQRFSPFSNYLQTPQSYSTRFNGSTDWITLPTSTGLDTGSSDFTIECWVNFLSTANSYVFSGSGATIQIVSGVLVTYNAANTNVTIGTPVIGQWAHVAVCRSGTTIRTFFNGVLGATVTNNGTIYTHSAGRLGAAISTGATPMAGYISNYRLVVGTAVYTSAFTPPTAPLTAITNTSLLTCQNATLKDNSTNAFALTVTGTPTPKPYNPFGYTTSAVQTYDPTVYGGSMYFDGTGDYLSLPANSAFNFGTSNLTMEAWIYPTTVSGNIAVFSFAGDIMLFGTQGGVVIWYVNGIASGWAGNTQTVVANQWSHIACVRNGTTCSFYLNGVASTGTSTHSESLGSSSAVFSVGYRSGFNNFTGYISNFRVINGTALYTSNFVPPLAPLTPVTNTSLLLLGTNAGIYDNAMTTIFETVGNAQISTTQKKYGTGSMYFDGTGDYLTAPYSKLQDLTSGDFTVEAWVYRNVIGAEHNIAVTRSSAGTDGWNLRINSSNTLQFYFTGGTSLTSTGTIPATTWTHVAATRSGTTLRLFINGVIDGSTTVSDGTTNTQPFRVGVANDNATGYMNGYIDDLRITKGFARYTANFTPPTAALPTS